MRLLERLFSPAPDPRKAMAPLWEWIVAEARMPAWYGEGGVADTLEGRFDMITLVLALVLRRMERSTALAPLTGPLTEIFVAEMDGQLRQRGVGDLMVGKQVGRLMSTLGGRLGALRAALDGSDETLAEVLRRNLTLTQEADAAWLARRIRLLAGRLDDATDAVVRLGDIA